MVRAGGTRRAIRTSVSSRTSRTLSGNLYWVIGTRSYPRKRNNGYLPMSTGLKIRIRTCIENLDQGQARLWNGQLYGVCREAFSAVLTCSFIPAQYSLSCWRHLHHGGFGGRTVGVWVVMSTPCLGPEDRMCSHVTSYASSAPFLIPQDLSARTIRRFWTLMYSDRLHA